MKKNKLFFCSVALMFIIAVPIFVIAADPVKNPGKPKISTEKPAGSPTTGSGSTFKSPIVTGGSGSGNGTFRNIQEVGKAIIDFIIKTIVPLVVAIALLTFLWGVLKFMRNAGDVKERESGRQFMLFGIIGLAVMVSVWGLVQILTNTIGQPLELPGLKQLGK